MKQLKRREFLKTTAGVAAGATVGPMIWVKDAQAQWSNTPEKGAKLRVLRWKRFVQGDEDQYLANVKKFTEKYGIEVRVDAEGWEDVRPKAAVAANTGAGPDIILSTNDDANLYPDKLLDVTDVCALPRQEVRRLLSRLRSVSAAGRQEVDRRAARRGRRLHGLPREPREGGWLQHLSEGHRRFPEAVQGAEGQGHAARIRARQRHRRRQVWCQWLVWAFGGKLVDENNKVVIDSPETLKALEYAKELYATFVPGTLSWLDPNNNKAFLDEQISLTNNGISIYYAAKTSKDPKVAALAADINHANMPIGPIGKPSEFQLFFNQMIFKYTKYPKAAKEFLRFMMEEEQMNPWVEASIGYVTPALTAYEKNPIWTSDPKHTPYRDSMKNMWPSGYAGKMGYASAGALADFIVVNMVAEAASGSKTPKEAAERAQKRAERYYKV